MHHTAVLGPLLAQAPVNWLADTPVVRSTLHALGEGIDLSGAWSNVIETWSRDDVVLTLLLPIDAASRWQFGALAVRLGDLDDDVLRLPLSIALPARPVQLAILASAALNGDADLQVRDDLELPASYDALAAMLARELQPAAVRASIGPVAAHLILDAEWLQVATPEHSADGAVVGFEADPDDAPVIVPLGSASLTLAGDGSVTAALEEPESLELPALMLRGSGVVIDVDGVRLARSGEEIVGVHLDQVQIWGLDSVLPFLPAGNVADGASSVTATDWTMTAHGLSGALTVTAPGETDDAFDVDQLVLRFEDSWCPRELRVDGAADLGRIVGADSAVLPFVADLRVDPFAIDPRMRWAAELSISGGSADRILRITEGLDHLSFAALALMAGDAADLAGLAAAVAVLTEDDRVSLTHLDLTTLTADVGPIEVTTESGATRVQLAVTARLSATAGIELRLPGTDGDRHVPLELASGRLEARLLIGATTDLAEPRLRTDWSYEQLDVALPTVISVGDVLSITHAHLRGEGPDRLVLELGTQVSGGGDVHITGLPDLIRAVIDVRARTVAIELARNGETLTILVPGVLYATGSVKKGDDAALTIGGDASSWKQPVAASMRGFLIGNGTAVRPEDHAKRSSYLLDLEVNYLSAVHAGNSATSSVISLDAGFTPGLPLGASGAAIYGLGLTYAQNGRPRLGAAGDHAGWYLHTPPQMSTTATKWEPASDEWGFGASAVLGSAPDGGKAWNITTGLFLLLPGPIVMLTGRGDLFQPPPELNPTGPTHEASFGAAAVLDFPGRQFSVELAAQVQVAAGGTELLDLTVPAQIGVSLADPTQSFLHLGRASPLEERVRGSVLGLLTISGYLMLDGRGLDLPMLDAQTGRPRPGRSIELPGVALALGGLASVDWSFSASVISLRLYAYAGFDLGVSLSNPPLMVGLLQIGGGIRARAFGLGVELSVDLELEAAAPDPFYLSGDVRVRMKMPWFLPDINVKAGLTIGRQVHWPLGFPEPPAPVVTLAAVDPASTTRQPIDVLGPGGTGTPVPSTEIAIDAQLLLGFDVPVGNTSAAVGAVHTDGMDAPEGGSHAAWVWTPLTAAADDRRRGYRHVVTHIALTAVEGSRKVPSRVLGTWAAGTAAGNLDPGGAQVQPRTSGGQAARTHLTLFADGGDLATRNVGTGYTLTASALSGWKPCTTPDTDPWTRHYSSGHLSYLLPEPVPGSSPDHIPEPMPDEGRQPGGDRVVTGRPTIPFVLSPDVQRLLDRVPSVDRIEASRPQPTVLLPHRPVVPVITGSTVITGVADGTSIVRPGRKQVKEPLRKPVPGKREDRVLPRPVPRDTAPEDSAEDEATPTGMTTGAGAIQRVPLPVGRHRLPNLTPPDELAAWLRHDQMNRGVVARLARQGGLRIHGPIVRRGPFTAESLGLDEISSGVAVAVPLGAADPVGIDPLITAEAILEATHRFSGGLILELGRHDGATLLLALRAGRGTLDTRARNAGVRGGGPIVATSTVLDTVADVAGNPWSLIEVTVPAAATEVSLASIATGKDAVYADPAEPEVAVLLGARVVVDRAGWGVTHRQNLDASRSLAGELLDQADRWSQGSVDDLMTPGTTYELAVTVESWHASADASDRVEPTGSSVVRTYRSRFITATAVARQPLRALPNGLSPADEPPAALTEPEDLGARWEIAVAPAEATPAHYRADPLQIRLRRARFVAAVRAHGHQIQLRLIDSHGNDQHVAAELRFRAGHDLEADQRAVADAWRAAPCVLGDRDAGLLAPEAVSVMDGSLLMPGERYVAEVRSVPAGSQVGEWEQAPLLHRWRFRASRWQTLAEHLSAHTTVEEIVFDVDVADLRSRLAARTWGRGPDQVVVDEIELDRELFGRLGLQPADEIRAPQVRLLWNWDTAADRQIPFALLLDSPEPLLRSDTSLSLGALHPGQGLEVLTSLGRARTLLVPTDVLPAGDLPLTLTDRRGAASYTLNLGALPVALQTETFR